VTEDRAPTVGRGGALSVRRLSVTFDGAVKALSEVDIDIGLGEIVGLAGHNGSGKSTLIKTLSGYQTPDRGTDILMMGKPLHLPVDATTLKRHNVAFMHQDLGLANQLTVRENVMLLRPIRRRIGALDRVAEGDVVAHSLSLVGLHVCPETPLHHLPQSDRALVALARALGELDRARGGLLVLDEPSTRLARTGVDRLFRAINSVRDDGISVVVVSHKVDEMLEITDRVVVLRDGRLVTSADTTDLSEQRLVELITGSAQDALYRTASTPVGAPVLVASALTGGRVERLDLTLHRGEVLGVTGLPGSGYDELPYLLAGATPAVSGNIASGTADGHAQHSVRSAIKQGICLVPGDRHDQALAVDLDLASNMLLPRQRSFFRRLRTNRRAMHAEARRLLAAFSVHPARTTASARTLSGGNQQKVVLAKWMACSPTALLLHDPTQGVDVGAKREIYQHLRAAAAAGAGVLIASADFDEVAGVCDRVIVFARGRVVANLRGGGDCSAPAIARHALKPPPTSHEVLRA